MTGELALWLVDHFMGWIGALILSNIALYMWMSRRELERNESHKKELQEQQKEYLLLHIEIINQRILAAEATMLKFEAKSEAADADIKEELNKRKTNEHTLFQRDEKQYATIAKDKADLTTQLSELRAQLAAITGTVPGKKRK